MPVPENGPCADAIAVTPGDSGTGAANGDLTGIGRVRFLLVQSPGNLTFVNHNDVERTVSLLYPQYFPVHSIQRIKASGTTAGGIVAMVDN